MTEPRILQVMRQQVEDWYLETGDVVAVLAYVAELKRIVDQVDDVLIVCAVGPRADRDYRMALHSLITLNIKIENDPRVSRTAQARRVLFEQLVSALQPFADFYDDPDNNPAIRISFLENASAALRAARGREI